MPGRYLKQILKAHRTAYAVFDESLQSLDYDFRNSVFFSEKELGRNFSLWECFPLLAGYEDVVREILQGKLRQYLLEKINHCDDAGKLTYHTILLTAVQDKDYGATRLFCLVSDVTRETALEQSLRQKDYEVRVLRADLLSNGQFLHDSLLGESQPVAKVREFVKKVSQYQATVLLQGESGTGKSLVAKLIHRASPLSSAPFVEINCAAIPDTLMESELFGYEKGAFTNALSSKKGLIEEADKGSLFLDEIGELPLSLQAKLLTFLETQRFRRLGSTIERKANVRLLVASNKELAAAVEQKEFRQDLFFRLNVVTAVLPPLRELGEDILLLAGHFVELLAIDLKKQVTGLTPSLAQKLLSYDWPGNVRELRNALERAVIFCEGKLLDIDDLSLSSIRPVAESGLGNVQIPEDGLAFDDVERAFLEEALNKAGGNQTRAARYLDLSLDTFRYRLKKFKVRPGHPPNKK